MKKYGNYDLRLRVIRVPGFRERISGLLSAC